MLVTSSISELIGLQVLFLSHHDRNAKVERSHVAEFGARHLLKMSQRAHSLTL